MLHVCTWLQNCIIWLGITLRPHGSLVRIPKHPQQTLSQLLEAKTPLVWVEDENAQEHQQDEWALFFPSVKDTKTAQFLLAKRKA